MAVDLTIKGRYNNQMGDRNEFDLHTEALERLRQRKEQERLEREIMEVLTGRVDAKPKKRKNLSHQRSANVKHKYGLSRRRHLRLYEAQEFKCAICLTPETQCKRQLHVDHSHSTGEVRGLLCPNCNYLLAHAKDSIKTLQRAIEYLISPPNVKLWRLEEGSLRVKAEDAGLM